MATRQNASTGQFITDSPKDPAEVAKAALSVLQVKVWSPFKTYFDGKATSVSGINGTGPFDILPRHRNFITLLNQCELVLQTKNGEVRIRISGGVMQVHKNGVVVFLEV